MTELAAIRGDTLGPLEFRFLSADGTPFNLSGSVVSMRVGSVDEDSGAITLVFSASSAIDNDGLEITDAANGIVTIEIPPTKTKKLRLDLPTTFRIRRDMGGRVHTLLSGTLTVDAGEP